MKKKQLLFLVIVLLPLLAFISVPGAHAACGDAPGLFVDWRNCDKSGQDFSGQILAFMDLRGTNFRGSNLNSTNMMFAQISGTNFREANLKQANMSSISSLHNTRFVDAKINRLNLSYSVLTEANFKRAVGVPSLNSTTIATSICPQDVPSGPTSPFCSWVIPTAVTLSGFNAAAAPDLFPWAVVGLLLAGTAVIMLALRKRKVAAL